MTSSQAIPLPRRHPAWLAPLLFPAIPFLAGLLADPGAPASLARPTGLFALLMLGVAVSTALPSLLDWLGWGVRKEAE
jgi:hypothetical protein